MNAKSSFRLIITIVFCICLVGHDSFGQESDSDYVKLYNGEIIYAEDVIFKTPLLKKNYFLVDDIRYQPSYVAFYRDRGAVSANVSKLRISSKPLFIPRIESGKVNLFLRAQKGSGYTIHDLAYGQKVWLYFNEPNESLKKVSYLALSPIMKDNPDAMVFLNEYRKSNNLEMGLYFIVIPSWVYFPFLRVAYGFEVGAGVTGLAVWAISTWLVTHLNRHVQPRKIASAVKAFNN